MSVEYTIAAIPTLYRGRMYRSRLEARWAAFFDRLGWKHEYEPFDMGKWSPDFALTEFGVLVEVKPIAEFSQAVPVAEKIGSCGDRLLIVGTCPWPVWNSSSLAIGWRKSEHAPNAGAEKCAAEGFFETVVHWMLEDTRPQIYADLVCSDGAKTWTMRDGHISLERWNSGRPYCVHTEHLWADACNAVQWEPKQ
jgi:hypothetical protein